MTPKKAPSVNPPGNQLALRLISGIVMALASLALVIAGAWPFAALVVVAAGIGLWEWDGLTANQISRPFLMVRIALIAAACLFVLDGRVQLAALIIVAGVIMAFAYPQPMARRLWSAAGVAYLGFPALVLVWFRLDPAYGLAAILFLFFVVWASDSGAYFVGRVVGGPQLAPKLSPRKTWSGAIGGLLSSAITALLFAIWLGNGAVLALTLVGCALSLAAQLGDLAESAVKRGFDIKDSSHLIPGHGGLLDRIDALLLAALAAAGLVLARGAGQPGQALLIWS